MKSSKRINSRGNRPRRSKAIRVAGQQAGGREELEFMGFVNEKVKRDVLGVSTALVLTSVCNYVEAFSLAITEAWARGRPVVASAVGEIPYRVRHMVNGLLEPPWGTEPSPPKTSGASKPCPATATTSGA